MGSGLDLPFGVTDPTEFSDVFEPFAPDGRRKVNPPEAARIEVGVPCAECAVCGCKPMKFGDSGRADGGDGGTGDSKRSDAESGMMTVGVEPFRGVLKLEKSIEALG